jgi:predicted AlkP superfamily phosphohydrolase/phosphomutase
MGLHRVLVIGLDCAAPDLLLGDERLVNLRRLMAAGCYGRLESVVPPITVPAWMCLATSQDPGSLGVYGFRNRRDYSYGGLSVVDSSAFRATALWDVAAAHGGIVHVVGVPPNYPPRPTSGISVGCFLTPDPAVCAYTAPAEVKYEIRRIVGDYPVDAHGFRTDDKRRLRDAIWDMTRKHFAVVRHYVAHSAWDYFQFVEIGLDRIHHGFWRHHDPLHVRHEPHSPWQSVVRDYYALLDEELGRLLELLDEETVVLVVSDHGARRLEGGFCVNEWLMREGLLALHERPAQPTPLGKLAVDWSRTFAWSEGGYCARVFLNVRGREPQGTIDPADYERVRDDIAERLRATVDDRGQPLGTLVFKPEEVYRRVEGIAPDLIVHFGGLAWRSIGGVGYDSIHVQENDTGPDDCNHAQHGAFVLAAPHCHLRGELTGVHLLDIAPTLADLAGWERPASFQGRSLLERPVTELRP